MESSRLHGDGGGKIVEVGVSYPRPRRNYSARKTCRDCLCTVLNHIFMVSNIIEIFHSAVRSVVMCLQSLVFTLDYCSKKEGRRSPYPSVLFIAQFQNALNPSKLVLKYRSEFPPITTYFLLFSNSENWPSSCCTTPGMSEQTVPFGVPFRELFQS